MGKKFFRSSLTLILILCACFLVEGMSRWITLKNMDWYHQMPKPSWSPPSWAFGPVWTLLYLLMGVSFWMVLQTQTKKSKGWAYLFFWGQLALNGLWSFLFFGLHSPILGMINLSLLLFFIVMTIGAFYQINRFASYLLIPYLAWVLYATTLNGFYICKILFG